MPGVVAIGPIEILLANSVHGTDIRSSNYKAITDKKNITIIEYREANVEAKKNNNSRKG